MDELALAHPTQTDTISRRADETQVGIALRLLLRYDHLEREYRRMAPAHLTDP
jgi:hypothetical protein